MIRAIAAIVTLTTVICEKDGRKISAIENKNLSLRYNLLKSLLENERKYYNDARRIDIVRSVNHIIRDSVRNIENILGDPHSRIEVPVANILDESKDVSGDDSAIARTIEDALISVKSDIQRYMTIKNKIFDDINREPISDKTKSSIIAILNSALTGFENGDCSRDFFIRSNIQGKKKKILKEGNRVLTDDDEPQIIGKLSEFLEEMKQSIRALKRKYRKKCRMSKVQNLRSPSSQIRDNNTNNSSNFKINLENLNKKNLCQKYKICPDILISFLTDFHQSINDTIVNTLRNYGAMYSKDIGSDGSNEQEAISKLIINVLKAMDPKILEIFENMTHGLIQNIKDEDWSKLSKTQINEIFDEYIANTIAKLTTELHDEIDVEFKSLEPKLIKQSAVKDDININFKLELGNLCSTISEKLCSVFELCNRKAKRKLLDKNWKMKLKHKKMHNRNYRKTTKRIKYDTSELKPKTNRRRSAHRVNNKHISRKEITSTDHYTQIYPITRTTYRQRNDTDFRKKAIAASSPDNKYISTVIIPVKANQNLTTNQNRTVVLVSNLKANEIEKN